MFYNLPRDMATRFPTNSSSEHNTQKKIVNSIWRVFSFLCLFHFQSINLERNKKRISFTLKLFNGRLFGLHTTAPHRESLPVFQSQMNVSDRKKFLFSRVWFNFGCRVFSLLFPFHHQFFLFISRGRVRKSPQRDSRTHRQMGRVDLSIDV